MGEEIRGRGGAAERRSAKFESEIFIISAGNQYGCVHWVLVVDGKMGEREGERDNQRDRAIEGEREGQYFQTAHTSYMHISAQTSAACPSSYFVKRKPMPQEKIDLLSPSPPPPPPPPARLGRLLRGDSISQ